MKLKLQRPIACCDLETTGISITKDRIVEIAIIKVMPDGDKQTKVMRINPEMAIPENATAIHGISDADVAQEPTFREVANEIKQFIEHCDLCGYNSTRFDFALLTEEFLRVGIDIDLKSRNLIDAQQIFMKKEPRTLAAAYKYYCDKELENAHSALADAAATFDILLAQVDRYDDIGSTPEELSAVSGGPDLLDYARRLKLVNGVPTFNFGKYKEVAVTKVFDKEPQYFDWIMRSDFAQDTKNVLSKIYTEYKLKQV